jgi:hypothetical protein
MRWNIILECGGGDGKRCTITLGTIERLAGSTTAENLGVNLQESKQIVNRLQDTVIKQQLQEHSEQRRNCIFCGRLRPVKDYRRRRVGGNRRLPSSSQRKRSCFRMASGHWEIFWILFNVRGYHEMVSGFTLIPRLANA